MPDDTALPLVRQRPSATARQILGAPPGPGQKPVRSLYIHVPFCAHKCHYCDFYSFVDSRDRQHAFADRLADELRALAPLAGGQPLRTVFIGGGTPTLLDPPALATVLGALHAGFTILPAHDPDGTEFTVECNPETASASLMRRLAEGGVNRISIGAQTFNPGHLRTLERRHDPDNVERALVLARDAGIGRRSIDLIYAIPGQTERELAEDLDRALALPIDHLSAYSLTYEPNTAMTKRLERGEFQPAAEDLDAAMFLLVGERAAEAGFQRYEISNFARQGSECRHNLAYWRQESWLAAGPSGSAFVHGHRYKNVARLDDYLTVNDAGYAPITDHEPPDEARLLAETMMTGLRLREGIDASEILAGCEACRPGSRRQLQACADGAAERGWLRISDDRWLLTAEGLLFADGIAADLMALVLP